MDYKKTLLMPTTKFEMRANLTQKEKNFREKWEKDLIYIKSLDKNKDNEPFIVHDGPPYANGDLHVGHALNKILKDIIVRYKTLSGYYSPFVAGWDTHGLPIEHKMLQEMNISKDELNPLILRKKAAKYALKQVENQKKQFKTLQLFSDLEKIYVTLDKKYESKQLQLFKKMVLDGLVYKHLKPVYWSPSSQSALAEAEVEYADVVSNSIYVAFNIINSDNSKVNANDKLIIWTTTPWTLIANSGVAVGENITYIKVFANDNYYIVAKDLLQNLQELFKWDEIKIITELTSQDLVGVEYLTPITNNNAWVVIGHHVTLEVGTGLVHIAPLFGEDDFLIGKTNNLEMIMHISDNGNIDFDCDYDGMFYEDSNEKIIGFLRNNKSLVLSNKIKHSYPHDWRTHKPIIFRGTPQWFVSIDKIRNNILSELKNVKMYPEWAYKRLSNMIENRGDWTISRQRTWGVPIIIFYDKDKQPVIDEKIFDYVIKLIEDNGSDIWWEKEADDLLPENHRNKGYTKEMDIMDVWFDSGTSNIAADVYGFESPYDVYLEGSDQYRGWFNSSLINSVAYKGKAPYKNLISHGFVLDGKGEKMSKSKGNIISPLDVVNQKGADILRLWAANSEYSNDINISEDILNQNAEVYRKIRNTLRFMISNTNDYKYDKNLKLEGIHEFINEELKVLIKNVHENYNSFKFINVIKEINNYIVNLSSFYLSIVKDLLYVESRDNIERQMVLKNLYEITDFIILALAPILPTTSEEAYSFFNKENKEESIMLERFVESTTPNYELINKYNEFFELRDQINILIENSIKNGEVKRSNELDLSLKTDSEFIKNLNLKMLLMVGKVSISNETKVSKFDSKKCERCWNHFEREEMYNDEICVRCYDVISSLDDFGGLDE
ncbi:isoleucine--tRNA ligase [Mycoplasma anserisalpingitidis]|uniref:isoleucine--tRNA ligase n=1 Tax=Mycoplasma anserisalpingitidis TaxID=519450 RepID=UPI001CF7055B|nr:isoleucine--tRNA ligase [Mycoplasma anserisalpingitidis]UCU26407.1 isoleucine--tRNA ligase [Mycoplasma anserisalpingitidis]UCU27246.1 isoleucine--tRNA ligase [Mycoplasma anserisalpingitidis]